MVSSGGSVYNVYAEEEEDGETSAAAQQSLENSITMNKMKLLKAKMEDMNLNKKVRSEWDHRNQFQFYCKCDFQAVLIITLFLNLS